MRSFHILAFDDHLYGTATSYYTSSPLNEQLGQSDGLALTAILTDVGGTSPTLNCQLEHSCNQRHWLAVGTAEIAGAIANETTLLGVREYFGAVSPMLSYVRVKIWLTGGGGGVNCRLKLFVTGRQSKAQGRKAGNGSRTMGGGAPPS